MTKSELISRLEEIQKEIRQLPQTIEGVDEKENDRIQEELNQLEKVMRSVVRI